MEFVVSQYLRNEWPVGLGESPGASTLAPSTDPVSWLRDRVELIHVRQAAPAPAAPSSLGLWLDRLREGWNDFKANPKAFFISQYKGAFNTREDTPGNGNCGPTSLAMVAKAFGKLNVTPEQADEAIERTRIAMTGKNNQFTGTGLKQLAKGAASYGLTSREVSGSLAVLQQELALGRLPIVLIKPVAMGLGSKSTGHYVVVTKIDEKGIHANDPAKKTGPVVYSQAAFMKGWKAKGSMALSVGP